MTEDIVKNKARYSVLNRNVIGGGGAGTAAGGGGREWRVVVKRWKGRV